MPVVPVTGASLPRRIIHDMLVGMRSYAPFLDWAYRWAVIAATGLLGCLGLGMAGFGIELSWS